MSESGDADATGFRGLPFFAGFGSGMTVQVEESEDLQTWKSVGQAAHAVPGTVTELLLPGEEGGTYRWKVTTIDAAGRFSCCIIHPRTGPDRGGRP